MCPAERLRLREPHIEGGEGRTLLSWVGSQLSLLLPKRLWLGPEVALGNLLPSKSKAPWPKHQALPGLAPRLGFGGGPGATFQLPFQLLLDNLSISCLGCKSQPFPSRPPPASARCLALC